MQAIVVIDLGFGDAGKGSLVDYLVRRHRATMVVRFNGGAQAAHNVVTPEGQHHCFSQFGSGTLVGGAGTHLSRFMLVDPVALLQEEKHLGELGVTDALHRMTIAPAAPVVTPFQRAANRLRELLRGNGRHGSCGMGIGETMADLLAEPSAILRAGELRQRTKVLERLRFWQDRKRREFAGKVNADSVLARRELSLLEDPQAPEEFAKWFEHVARQVRFVPTAEVIAGCRGTVVFEGAQGVLLDEWHGFHPYTTWSTTTFDNAMTLLNESAYAGRVTRIGAVRAYMTRHGPGPFVTEDRDLACRTPDAHNGTNPWQREFRVGWLDLVKLRYALAVAGGVDELAVTCLDRLRDEAAWKVCCRYESADSDCLEGDYLRVSPVHDLAYQERLTRMLERCRPTYTEVEPSAYLGWLEEQLGYPIRMVSEGPTWADKWARVPVLDCGGCVAG